MKIATLLIVFLVFTAIYQNLGNRIEVECTFEPNEYVVIRLDTENGGYFSKLFKFTRAEFQPSGIKLEQGIHTKFFASISANNVKYSKLLEKNRELISVRIDNETYELGVVSNQCSRSIRVLVNGSKEYIK